MNSPIISKGDSGVVRWYPMRIFHSSAKRQLELKEELDKEKVVEETYVPLKLIDAEANRFAPALLNYIFVRITLDDLRELKEAPRYNTLRYVMSPGRDDKYNKLTEIAYIPDCDMMNFQQVINSFNEQVLFIQNNDFAMRPGQKVMITDGVFKGVEGTLKSIKKHLCVVVTLNGIMAVAITGIHRKHIVPVDSIHDIGTA